ncbi:DNA-binding response regulator (plasmid) [Azospirillum sp. TSH58]|uniref:response regulator transcription factor n=1 Tax=Azospirillum sp. TSH58 TaxID=664962 RepID=UPI000D600944|nr:response regulator transcription factor [Azospirillum sp. TSH58]AWJ86380.1 DNA-binding response regulator [Azospirillum sp. TSH58]PWC70041.1 LuxR family transcriptional regulator [Azospirillum sp. TSH58]
MTMKSVTKPRDVVLVVDDSPEALSFLTDALEEAGVTVLVALDGRKALALLEQVTPDVILMDAIMPGLDGFETCRHLKRSSQVAHVPVIFMTGLTETEHILKGFAAGGVDYVTKPIVAETLIARMYAHLANARVAQSTRAALDVTGRTLLAANHRGEVLWCTPQTTRMLEAAFGTAGGDGVPTGISLPEEARRWLADRQAGGPGRKADSVVIATGADGRRLRLSPVGQTGADEILLQLAEETGAGEDTQLKDKLSLTPREAEVLMWVANGKPNRDIAEILGLSPRTVDKHLEQIYAKLGVENRAAAAAMAVRALNGR